MSTTSLQAEQNDLIRRILDVKDLDLLRRVKALLNAEVAIDDNVKEPDLPYTTREEIESHLERACEEVRKIREGELVSIKAEDLLNEL